MADEMDDLDNVIMHYGVKGMKWGRRKSRPAPQLARTPSKSKDQRTVNYIKTKKPSAMTNDELRKLNTRTDLMTKYRQANPTKLKKAEKLIKTLLAAGATVTSLVALLNQPYVKAAIAQGKDMIDQIDTGVTLINAFKD